MKSKIKDAIIFIIGAASGAAGMLFYMKKKWQKNFEVKQDEMIQYFEKKKLDQKKEVTEEPKAKEKGEEDEKDISEARTIVRNFNYSRVYDISEKTKNDTPPVLNDADYSLMPYEIDPREFGGQEMYEMVTLYLYDDGEVRTEKYELLDDEDIENYIGNLLERVADLRDANPDMDSFYCRNDRLKTDYEILIEAGRYEEMNR